MVTRGTPLGSGAFSSGAGAEEGLEEVLSEPPGRLGEGAWVAGAGEAIVGMGLGAGGGMERGRGAELGSGVGAGATMGEEGGALLSTGIAAGTGAALICTKVERYDPSEASL
jgi:hypothetical protein